MIKVYKTLENRMTELPEYSEGCWVSAVCPTPDEIRYLIEQLGVDAQYISAALDEEESSRIESEDGQTLVIIDVPYMEEEQEEKTVVYTTTSIGIILTPANFITVSARETLVIDEFAEGQGSTDPSQDTRPAGDPAAGSGTVPALSEADRPAVSGDRDPAAPFDAEQGAVPAAGPGKEPCILLHLAQIQ